MPKKFRKASLLLAIILGLSGRVYAKSTATVTVGGSEQPGDSGSLTISFTDSAGNTFTETVNYGQFSTATAIASAFGAKFSNQYISAGLCAHAVGSKIVFQLQNGAILGAPSISGPSSSFSLTNTSATPTITSILPNPAAVGVTVILYGASFGATQGSSTITFNGVSASPSSWSDNAIVVSVPSGAATGNVVVTVGGQASNAVLFTVPVSCP